MIFFDHFRSFSSLIAAARLLSTGLVAVRHAFRGLCCVESPQNDQPSNAPCRRAERLRASAPPVRESRP
jgi:hypothetical protein